MSPFEKSEHDKQKKAEAEKRARDEQVTINAFHRVFKSDDGKLILDFLIQYFGLDNPAFIPKADRPYDPLEAAYRDGQRSMLLQVYRFLKRPCIGDANIQTKPKVIK